MSARAVTPSDSPYWTVAETSAYAKLCEAIVRREIAKGNLKAVKVGGAYRVHRSAVEAWLAAAEVAPTVAPEPAPKLPAYTGPRRLQW